MILINESLWINPYHGMELDPGFEDQKRGNENGILFLTEYYFLKSLLGSLDSGDRKIFETIVKSLQTYDSGQNRIPGLYDRGAGESLTIPPENRRTISRDNLLAIASFSYKFGLGFNRDIYRYGMGHFWRFDNCYPESPRWSRFMWNLTDIIYFMRVSENGLGSVLGWAMMWLFYVAQFHTIITKYAVRPAWYTKVVRFFQGKRDYETRKFVDTSGPWLVFCEDVPSSGKKSYRAYCLVDIDQNS